MKTNCYNVTLTVQCVPGDNKDAIFEELIDVLNSLYQLPYDYDMKVNKIGELL